MPGLLHNGQFVRAVPVSLCGEPRPQAVSRIGRPIETDPPDGALDDHSPRAPVQDFALYPAVAVHLAEYRSGADPGVAQPLSISPDGACLRVGTKRQSHLPSLPFL